MATIEYDDILLNIGSRLQGKALDNAIKNLESMGNALKDIKSNDFKSATDDIKGFVSAIKPVAKSTVQSYKDLAKAMSTIASKAGKAMKAVGGDKFQRQSMAELEEIAKRSGGKSQAGIPDWEMDWYRDTSWSGQVASATSEAQGLKSAIDGIDSSTEDAYNDLKAYLELYPKTKDSYLKNQMGYDPDTIAHVRQDLYMIAEDSKRAGEGVGEITKQATKSLTPMEKLANKFKNFLQYRAMRAIWSGFINGAKEGLKNLEEWDRAMGKTGFADSMDRARDSLLTLKNALAIITAPALEWISGVLQSIAHWAVGAANAVSRFFAILGGKSTYRVIKYAEGVSAAEKSAAGSAKKANEEFKKQLMGFDEINNLTAPGEGGSGGGGSGGGGGGLGSMFGVEDVGELGAWGTMISKIGNAWREMAEKIRTTDDATSRHLNTVGKVWQGWIDFFADPKASWSNWIEGWNEGIQKIKENWNAFIGAFKTARQNGANFFDALEAGFNAISKEPEKFEKATRDATLKAGKHIDDNVIKKFHESGDASDTLKDKFKDMGASAKTYLGTRSIWDGVTTPLKDAGINAQTLWDKLKGITSKEYTPVVRTTSIGNAQTSTDNLNTSLDIVGRVRKTDITASSVSNAKTVTDGLNTALNDVKTARKSNITKTSIDEANTSAGKLKESLNKVEGTYKVNINTTENKTVNTTEYVTKYLNKNGQYVQMNAGGGIVSTGQMFVAREAGPELVGTIGGHTAVANNDQIVAAVSQGVASAVSAVLGNNNTNVNVVLEGDAKGLFRVVQQESRAYTARTGQLAMA